MGTAGGARGGRREHRWLREEGDISAKSLDLILTITNLLSFIAIHSTSAGHRCYALVWLSDLFGSDVREERGVQADHTLSRCLQNTLARHAGQICNWLIANGTAEYFLKLSVKK